MNHMQYRRILVRRAKRQLQMQRLSAKQAQCISEVFDSLTASSTSRKVIRTRTPQKYKYESRHSHALKRERLANGQFAARSTGSAPTPDRTPDNLPEQIEEASIGSSVHGSIVLYAAKEHKPPGKPCVVR